MLRADQHRSCVEATSSTAILNRFRCLHTYDFLVSNSLSGLGALVSHFKNNKNRLYVSVATSVVSLCLSGVGVSESSAQSATPQVLPPVSVDAPRPRARVAPTARPRATSQRAARIVARQPDAAPPAPVTTMGTTRTIGAPAPAYA